LKIPFIDTEEISSEDLVPGDVISIENMVTMQCDAVLLDGTVVVNESMLTGESVPVTKTAFDASSVNMDKTPVGEPNITRIDVKQHSKSILFNGTQVLQTRFVANGLLKAVVLRTGFITTKGELIRSILYPKPVDFKFNRDIYKYIGGLAMIASLGMIVSLTFKIMLQNPLSDIIKRTLDIVTIAVPPVLPGALAAGLIFAQNRLKKLNIFCISPSTINISGSLNTFVFDKTGTLTEDGLDLKCVAPVFASRNEFGAETGDFESLNYTEFGDCIRCMVTCHSLTRIAGHLIGDPLDLKMFEFTNYELEEPPINDASKGEILVTEYVFPRQNLNVIKKMGVLVNLCH
jgi:magnesium-transporting ATPase (P-type)